MHAHLLLVSKLVSHRLMVQFNPNRYINKSCDGEVIAIAPRKRNLYKIHFMKVHKAEVANLVQSPTGDGTLELWHRCLGHLNIKGVHTLQNMLNGINLGTKIVSYSHRFVNRTSKANNIGLRFQTRGEASNQTFGNCAFRCVWPHEDHTHRWCKVFCNFL